MPRRVSLAGFAFAGLVLAGCLLAACGEPAEVAPARPTPTPEAEAVFAPRPMVYEPSSDQARAFTGALSVAPLEPVPAGDPAPLKIESATGLYFETRLLPADRMAAPRISWASLFAYDGLAAKAVEIHEVVRQEALASAPNGGLCGEQGVYALAVVRPSEMAGPGLRIAAFGGNEWPPLNDKALCGTFSYVARGS